MNHQVCNVCRTPGCIEARGPDFHLGRKFGSLTCDYSSVPPFADAEWADDEDPLCLWCAGTGHPYGDESYGMCECPKRSNAEMTATSAVDYPVIGLTTGVK